MLGKRELGLGFLAGMGIGLIVSLLGYVTIATTALVTSVLVIGTGTVLSAMLIGAAVWLNQSDLPDETVWVVAQWSTIGLGIGTVLVLPLVYSRHLLLDVDFFPSLVTNVIAAGGMLGLFVGVTADLRVKYHRLRQLNEQNSVLHRTLRHDIRNDMSVIKGHAELLLEGSNVDHERSVRVILRKADEVVGRAHNIRVIDSLINEDPEQPIDLWEIIESALRKIESNYPEATITVNWPDLQYVPVPALTHTILDNLVENAIEHNDRDPSITIEVDVADETGNVEIAVTDNGPGIPESERNVLEMDRETALSHGNGIGLWMVKWIAEYFDGSLDIQNHEPRGSTVTVRLPLLGHPGRGSIKKIEHE